MQNFFYRNTSFCVTFAYTKKLTSHIFRHTLVSHLAENRVPLKAIMDRVGHADAKTTIQIYTHVTKKMKSNVADIMENY